MGAAGGPALRAYPVACDVNAMASDHMWNNLEDVRKAKSYLGTGLLVAGGAATAIGARHGSDEAVIAGLGAMAAGLLLKASAHADTRHCDVLPQRFYLVPLYIAPDSAPVQVQIEGLPATRMVLAGLTPPTGNQPVQLRYVRLVSTGVGASLSPPAWAVSG